MDLRDNRIFKLIGLFRRAFAGYKWRIALMAGLSFCSGILEGVGINAVIPIFSLIDGRQGDKADVISRTIEKFFAYLHIDFTVRMLVIFIMSLFIIRAAILFLNQYIVIKISTDYVRKTRAELFGAMLKSDWPYLSKQKVGYLEQLLVTDISVGSGLLLHISLSILTLVNLLVYGLIVFNISAAIAILVMILGLVIFLVFKPLFYKNRVASGEISLKNKEVTHFVSENIIGMKIIKSMFLENSVFQKSLGYFERMRSLGVRVSLLGSFTNILMQPLGLIFILGIFAFFYKTSAFSFASFAVIVYSINKVFGALQSAQGEAHEMSSRAPNLMNVLNYKEEAQKHREKDIGADKFSFKDKLDFRDVSFAYDGGAEVLKNVSFTVKKGEMLGLVGPSGTGKTTIVDLLLRLFQPQKGRITLDGCDSASINLSEWRANIGYVSQDIFLINDTVVNNIRFYNDSISEEDMIWAAKAANIYDFIVKQPQGFETVVGERGVRMSNGQRQRIVLARILARRPQLLILDEATSALDNESEVLIQKSIEELRGKITVVAIAHRLSTVANFDQVIVLEEGKIIETGNPRELLKDRESYFSKVYNLKK